MKFLLFFIIVMAFIMLTIYFIALITQSSKLLILFRITMLIVIGLLLISWIVSIILKQPFHLLLGLAVIFILLYVFS